MLIIAFSPIDNQLRRFSDALLQLWSVKAMAARDLLLPQRADSWLCFSPSCGPLTVQWYSQQILALQMMTSGKIAIRAYIRHKCKKGVLGTAKPATELGIICWISSFRSFLRLEMFSPWLLAHLFLREASHGEMLPDPAKVAFQSASQKGLASPDNFKQTTLLRKFLESSMESQPYLITTRWKNSWIRCWYRSRLFLSPLLLREHFLLHLWRTV